MDYTIVTVSNRFPQEWYYLHKEFFKSLNGHKVVVVNYSLYGGLWRGLTTKPKWLYEAIKNGIIDTKYMIFTDCWDLVFATEPEEVIDIYKCFNSDIVISAEKNCFPTDLKEDYDKVNLNSPHQTPYKYLNSGFIVGETDAIKVCLEEMDLSNMRDDGFDEEKGQAYHGNDQFEWQKIFLQQPVGIQLDENQLLSQTLHGADIEDFDFSKERIRNKVTGAYPCSFHFNGGSKDDSRLRNPILKHLKLM